MATDPHELLTCGFLRRIKGVDIPSVLYTMCCNFVFQTVDDGGDYYIDPPRVLYGKIVWEVWVGTDLNRGSFGYRRRRGIKEAPGPLIYFNFEDLRHIYEDRLGMSGRYCMVQNVPVDFVVGFLVVHY